MFFAKHVMIKINDHDHNVNDDYDDDVGEDNVDDDDDGDDGDDDDDDGGDDPGQERLGNVEPRRHSFTEGNNCQRNAGFHLKFV